MPISRPKSYATCHDCQQRIDGSITIDVYDFAFHTPVGVAEGSLPQACAEHHDQRREWGKENAPQHSEFSVFTEKGLLGEIRVASMTREHRFVIEDRETQKEFFGEISRLQRERGYR